MSLPWCWPPIPASAPGPPNGPAGGQLGGTYPDPDVRGLRETTGPTLLTLGAVADLQYLQRSGATVVGGPGGAALSDANPVDLAQNPAPGVGATASRFDHVHAIPVSDNAPQDIGVTDPGVIWGASRVDHVHAHGSQAGEDPVLHDLAVPGGNPEDAGFMSGPDKAKLDALGLNLEVVFDISDPAFIIPPGYECWAIAARPGSSGGSGGGGGGTGFTGAAGGGGGGGSHGRGGGGAALQLFPLSNPIPELTELNVALGAAGVGGAGGTPGNPGAAGTEGGVTTITDNGTGVVLVRAHHDSITMNQGTAVGQAGAAGTAGAGGAGGAQVSASLGQGTNWPPLLGSASPNNNVNSTLFAGGAGGAPGVAGSNPTAGATTNCYGATGNNPLQTACTRGNGGAAGGGTNGGGGGGSAGGGGGEGDEICLFPNALPSSGAGSGKAGNGGAGGAGNDAGNGVAGSPGTDGEDGENGRGGGAGGGGGGGGSGTVAGAAGGAGGAGGDGCVSRAILYLRTA